MHSVTCCAIKPQDQPKFSESIRHRAAMHESMITRETSSIWERFVRRMLVEMKSPLVMEAGQLRGDRTEIRRARRTDIQDPCIFWDTSSISWLRRSQYRVR